MRQGAALGLGGFRHLVADGIGDDAGVVVVPPGHGRQILLPVGFPVVGVVVTSLVVVPHIPGFVDHIDAVPVAGVQHGCGARVVGRADGVEPRLLELAHPALLALGEGAGAHHAVVVMDTGPPQFDGPAVDQQALAGVPLDAADAEGHSGLIQQFAAFGQGDAAGVEGGRILAPEPGVGHREGEVRPAARSHHPARRVQQFHRRQTAGSVHLNLYLGRIYRQGCDPDALPPDISLAAGVQPHRPVDAAAGIFKITNRFYFTNLKKYQIHYSVLSNNKTIKSGKVSLDIAPQASKEFTVPVNGLKSQPGTEYFVNFSVTTVEPEPLIPAGYEIAYDQFQLPIQAEKRIYKANGPALTTATSGDELTVSSSKVNFVFNKKSGLVTSYKVDGTEYFKDGFGIQPNFWRAPNDNDYGNGAPKRLQVWKQSSKNFHVTDVKMTTENKVVSLKATYLLAAGNLYVVTYRIYPSGIVNVSAQFTSTDMQAAETEVSEATRMANFTPGSDAARKAASKLEVPRIGVRFRLPAQMNNVQYFGRGPEENYIDRNHGTLVGVYKTTADKMYFNYVRPQENGHHTDTRWIALSPDKGNGLAIVADSLVGFNALRNSIEDFDSEEALPHPYQWNNFSPEEVANHDEKAARNVLRRMHHVNDITPRDFVEVCVDMKQQGVGGYDSWGARPEPFHQIPANRDYSWGFTLVPVRSASQANEVAKYDYQ